MAICLPKTIMFWEKVSISQMSLIVRTFRGPNIDTDHNLVVCKIRAKPSSITGSMREKRM